MNELFVHRLAKNFESKLNVQIKFEFQSIGYKLFKTQLNSNG